MTSALSLPKQLVIFDLDGVVYRGDTPTPHASEVISMLQSNGARVHFLTNNSSRTRESYCEKLAAMGIVVKPEEIMTSAWATALFLGQQGFRGRRVLAVGEDGLRAELSAAGIDVESAGDSYDGSPVEAVVVGIDRAFTYDRLKQAQQAIVHGARFIATNADPTFPTEEGDMPGGGSIVAAIRTASGQEPYVVGKPNTFSLELMLDAVGVDRSSAVLVGDRLDTDISVGQQAGLETVLTLTGVTALREAQDAPAGMRPCAIIPDLTGLLDLLGR